MFTISCGTSHEGGKESHLSPTDSETQDVPQGSSLMQSETLEHKLDHETPHPS